MSTQYVGVDVSQQRLDSAVWVKGQAQDMGQFSNDEAGFSQLKQALKEVVKPDAPIHIVLEPTGGYELGLVGYAYQQGWQVSLPNPQQVRDWAKGMGYRIKTDRVDARILSHYGTDRQPNPQPDLPEEVKTLDSLLKRRLDLEQMRRQERNRLHALQVRPSVPQAVVDSVQRVLALLEEELSLLEQELKSFFKTHASLKQELKRLQQVPGIGPKIAPFILLLLLRWQTLTDGQGTAKQLTAYVGLDPQPYSSGTSVYRPPTISRMGNATARQYLYLGALGGVRGHNPLRDFYQRLVGRGKPKKVALVAGARKILVWAWVIFSRQLSFDPKVIDPNFV